MKSKEEVFKIQKHNPHQTVLAYNEDKSKMGQFPLTPEVNKLFGKAFKIFVLGSQNKKGQILVKRKVKDPHW